TISSITSKSSDQLGRPQPAETSTIIVAPGPSVTPLPTQGEIAKFPETISSITSKPSDKLGTTASIETTDTVAGTATRITIVPQPEQIDQNSETISSITSKSSESTGTIAATGPSLTLVQQPGVTAKIPITMSGTSSILPEESGRLQPLETTGPIVAPVR